MRNKLLVLCVMAVFAVILVVATFAFNPAKTQAVCLKLIESIQDGNAEGSYALLSSEAQSNMSSGEWARNVDSLQDYYNNVEPTLKDRTTQGGGTEPVEHKERYVIKTSTGTYNLTCYAADDNSVVNAFSSEVELPGN